ncbi:MAG: phosphoribosylaminoimidazolesuccinocarboxamide synthase, partial [Flavobacteriales bacterium]
MSVLLETRFQFPGQTNYYKGKVRDVYTIHNDLLVMVASDRISAFDVVLPKGIPYKGQVLNQIAYKFLNGNNWGMPEEVVPAECGVDNGFGGYNRGLQVGEADSLLEVVCFGECIDCLPQTLVIVTLQVDMSNQSVTNDEVYVAGSFNGWNATESLMIPLGNGIYQLPIAINSGEDVMYKFINGTTWESVPADCGSADGFGGFNRAFTAPANNTEFTPVCFNECAGCVVVPTVMLTLTVEMTEVTISPMGVHVAGSFNNFSPTATLMDELTPGVFRTIVEVGQNEQVFFKFINGDTFTGAEIVPFECGTDDGFGGFNRSVTTNTGDVAMPTVCFSSCAPCSMGTVELNNNELVVFPNPAND